MGAWTWCQPQELHFTYIPSGAEIISIDAFNRSKVGDDFVIGVTIIKSVGLQDNTLTFTLTGTWTVGSFSWRTWNRAASPSHLEFIPYYPTHCEVEKLTVWLFGGSGRKVHNHIYSDDKAKNMYQEVEAWGPLARVLQ